MPSTEPGFPATGLLLTRYGSSYSFWTATWETSCAGWACPGQSKDWSLRSLQEKLIEMGGRMVHHARRIIFQLAEVAIPEELFAALLGRIARLGLAPG